MSDFDVILDERIKITEIIPYDNPVIIECGSNDGLTAICFLDRFLNIQLFCFEPDPRYISEFKNRIQDNRCKLYETALASIDGEMDLYQSYSLKPGEISTSGSNIKGTSRHKKLHPFVDFLLPIKVKTIRLDTWREKNGIDRVDFIWADVEGAEEDLIRGGIETLKRTHYFYTEYDNNQNFDNQINLDKIKELLPDFEIIFQWEHDVFFHNIEWKY